MNGWVPTLHTLSHAIDVHVEVGKSESVSLGLKL